MAFVLSKVLLTCRGEQKDQEEEEEQEAQHDVDVRTTWWRYSLKLRRNISRTAWFTFRRQTEKEKAVNTHSFVGWKELGDCVSA